MLIPPLQAIVRFLLRQLCNRSKSKQQKITLAVITIVVIEQKG